MKAQQKLFKFIKQATGRSTLLSTVGELVPFANNSYNHARFISQLIFWTEGNEDWNPIPFKEWKQVTKLSKYAVNKARYFFWSLGVLQTKVFKDSDGNPVVHYKLDFKLLMKLIANFFKMEIEDVDQLLEDIENSGSSDNQKSIKSQSLGDKSTKSKLHNKTKYINKKYGHNKVSVIGSHKYDNFYL